MEILQYPNKILTTKIPIEKYCGIHVDFEDAAEIGKMVLEMKNCHGIAAPQVGIPERFFVMREGLNRLRYCFNPEIKKHGKQVAWMNEGCMSIGYGDKERGGIFVPVPRWRVIDVEYNDMVGDRVKCTLTGIEARCFQHELDHLNGLLIIKTDDKTEDKKDAEE